MNGYVMAFAEQMKANGFTGPEPQWDGETRYLFDEACAKTFIKYKRDDTTGNLVTFTDSDGQSYFDYEGRTGTNGTGDPVFSGKRFLIGNSATPFQQNIGASWSAAAFEAMPLAGNPDDPDTFCFVQTDMYLSPQIRFCDYALPLAQTLEVVIANSQIGGQQMAMLPIQKPVGEAKDGWEGGFIAWNEQSKLGDFNDYQKSDSSWNTVTIAPNLGYSFIGEVSPRYISAPEKQRQLIQDRCNLSTSRFYGMSVEQAISEQFVPRTPSSLPAAVTSLGPSPLRARLNTYLSGAMNTPFIDSFGTGNPSGTSNGFNAEVNEQIARTTWSTGNSNNTAGHRSPITFKAAEGMPQDPRKITLYAEYAVYRWSVAYNRLHAWLPIDERGQKNEDFEGDPFLRPIPMYYAFEDDFNEVYGVHNAKKGITRDPLMNWKTVGPKPANADMSKIKDKLTLTVGTTHDRFRTHSTQNENPLMREQHHRVLGGGPANDWNEYLVVPEVHSLNGLTNYSRMLNTAVERKNIETASWHEFWMNYEDAAAFDIKDGDLLRLSNPIGAVRVIARLSKRVVRGHGNLHQGGWFDPNPEDGVDDGGCANTIMSVRPSKFDNGNAQQCAYVLVEKETNFFSR
jgi:anaerobic selenocysteine-containing dehydrogenase